MTNPDPTSRPTLAVILGSTRPGRICPSIGEWFVAVAQQHGGFAVELVDLAAVDLPLYDEPNHPRLGDYVHEHTKRWSAIVSAADAFAFVTPEYNHSFTSATKNAIDYLHNEWQNKAVGFVSYGGVSGGTRAIQALKPICAALRMVPVVESVSLPFPFARLDDDGVFLGDEGMSVAAGAMLDELGRWTDAMASLRT